LRVVAHNNATILHLLSNQRKEITGNLAHCGSGRGSLKKQLPEIVKWVNSLWRLLLFPVDPPDLKLHHAFLRPLFGVLKIRTGTYKTVFLATFAAFRDVLSLAKAPRTQRLNIWRKEIP